MAKISLTRTSNPNDEPICYADSTGRRFEFMAGKSAWSWTIVRNDFAASSRRSVNRIINAYIAAGLRQDPAAGGFAASTASIDVNLPPQTKR